MTQVFDAYARYYDLLYRDKDYREEAEYVAAQLRVVRPNAKRILELGCGTGAHAEHLARMGFEVHGVDFSAGMLEQAEIRRQALPSDLASRLSFSYGDARTVRIGQTYDAVISLFHVMSYQTRNEDLDAAFETAAIHLEQGGVFLFDFWYGPAVLTQRPEVRVRRLTGDEVSVFRVAEPVLHENQNVVDVNYTIFVQGAVSDQVHELHETHKMRFLFLPELERYGAEDRWRNPACFAWMKQVAPSRDDWAGLFVVERT